MAFRKQPYTVSATLLTIVASAVAPACSGQSPNEGEPSLDQVRDSLYWNDDVVSWYDDDSTAPVKPSVKNTMNVCWNGVFLWDFVQVPPHGSCTSDADCTGDDFCSLNAACQEASNCQCVTPFQGTWDDDPTLFATAKVWAEEAIREQWEDNSGLVFVWHDDCSAMTDEWVPIRLVSVDRLGGMGGVAQYGVGSRLGQSPLLAGTDPEAQIEMGIYMDHALSEPQFKAVAVHEMGHVLNAIHEHARPDAMNSCDVGGEFTDTGVQVTEPYDPDSIMNYCRDMDNDGTPDGYTDDVSEVVTSTDKAGIQAIYAFPDPWTDAGRNFCSGASDELLLGDVDGDGRTDLICNDKQGGLLSVDLASAEGTFTATDWSATKDFCQGAQDAAQVLDLNGDGHADLLCRENSTGYLRAIFGAADGSFPDVTWVGPFAEWCTEPDDVLKVGSFNGDDHDDLLCLSTDGTLSVQYSILPVFPDPQPEPPGCTEATAIDLGGDGNQVTVPNDGCVMVRNAYPSWWGTRTMQLQPVEANGVAVPYSWSNTCAGGSGSGSFDFNWDNQFLNPTNSSCATLIDLEGSGAADITLRYYGL